MLLHEVVMNLKQLLCLFHYQPQDNLPLWFFRAISLFKAAIINYALMTVIADFDNSLGLPTILGRLFWRRSAGYQIVPSLVIKISLSSHVFLK